MTCLLTVRVSKNSQIGAVLERLLCKLNCVGSCSITNLRHFRENRNAQGQAVWDFSGPANRAYCSQTFVFAKTAVLPIRAPRILYPALIVNIGLVGRWRALAREPEASSESACQIFQFLSSFGATFLQPKRCRVKQIANLRPLRAKLYRTGSCGF